MDGQAIFLSAKLQGKAEGKAEGLIEGEIKGIKTVAKKMLDQGVDIDTIVKFTGLSFDAYYRRFYPTCDFISNPNC